MCILDNTKPHDYDFKSNHKTIDATGFKNVEFMFEDLFQQQKNIDVERDFNQLEEEMNTILKKM
jgi:hydroxypyruvate isomerase